MYWQNGGFRKVMFSGLHSINFLGFFRNPGIIKAVPLGTFRRIWISGVHAINFFELSRNPLDLRSRDIMWLLQRACFWLRDIMFFRKGFDYERRDIMFRASRAPAEAFSVRCRGTR